MDECFIGRLEYIRLEGWEVPKSRWPFAHHLNKLHRRWTYFRRVLEKVKCPNPVTGELDTPFRDYLWGVGEEEGAFEHLVWGVDVHDDSVWRWTDGVRQDFAQSEARLESALARCVALISKQATKNRIELWGDEIDSDDAKTLLEITQMFAKPAGNLAWQHAFFAESVVAGSIVGQWEERLQQLQRDELLLIWKQVSVMRGARLGGIAGAAARRKVSKEQVAEYFAKLATSGVAARDAAAIVGRRLGIHPDHARRLRREALNPRGRGRTKPT